MTTTHIDPALVGIWLLPGAQHTYEIDVSGAYLIGEPEQPLCFENGHNTMIWGDRRFARAGTHGVGLVGTWIEEATGDAWDFSQDQALTILTPDEALVTGIWALRDQGRSLWHCERRATVTSDGAHLEFQFLDGVANRYGYAVDGDVLSLLDPQTWVELTRYISAGLYQQTIAS
jgi:hypothetical protein